MTDPKQIPHLINLLDDDSSRIRAAVTKELASFGPTLKSELKRIASPMNSTQQNIVDKILERHKRVRMKSIWPGVVKSLEEGGDWHATYRKLEETLTVLAEYLSGIKNDISLTVLLDELAQDYQKKFKVRNPVNLARFLFRVKGLCGDEEDYYNIQNCNLVSVIIGKKGIPISLASVYMLVGWRLGMAIDGCHFPGHFLARIDLKGVKVFVDCFNGGQVIKEKDLLSLKEDVFKGMGNVLQEPTDILMMVRAFLANLIRAAQVEDDFENAKFFISLFDVMDQHLSFGKVLEWTPETIINGGRSKYEPGQCIYHRRYRYRGIIVDVDGECEATDDWYYGNQTQPSRYQPWYHVLVHGTDQVTYVAENNLCLDKSNKKVKHPLITHFFIKTADGKYIRNNNAWPETDF